MSYFTILIIILVFFTISLVKDYEGFIAIFFVVLVVFTISPIGSYFKHVRDLGTVRAQHHVITIQEDRIKRLNTMLSDLSLPKGSVALLNNDSPIKAIVTQLSNAEQELSEAKIVKAEAMINIEQRSIGVFSFIVDNKGAE